MRYRFNTIVIFVVLCIGIGIRGIVSLSSYSGALTPPMFGDYEAQRHWQEITYNIPAKYWYSNSSENDLLYWGMDYPPLTAYHSLVLGMTANRINSSYVTLHDSRGVESADHKSFMRFTVLVGDLFLYIPAAAFVITSLKTLSLNYILPSLMLLVFYPCQILIDNGHFQYNNISLGLFLMSVASLLRNRRKTASLFFTLALNYKQMELYHALPIFVYLLKTSFTEKSILKNVFKLTEVGFVTLLTFIILWMPWLSSINYFSAVVLRLFPLNRRVFEDKVANIWCSLNAIYKFKENLPNGQMALICLAATLIAIIPTNIHLFFDIKKQTFLFSLVNTSLSFFLLSFQVHEKSILLAAIPACLIFETMPFSILCFLNISTLSVFPLLVRDNLYIVYFCIVITYIIIFKYFIQIVYSKDKKTQRNLNIFKSSLDCIILTASFATLFFSPPERYPYLWSFLISVISCLFFIIFLCELHFYQYYNFLTSFNYFKARSLNEKVIQ